MEFTPGVAKSIAEKFTDAAPVLSTKGQRKGDHIKYAYRFAYHGKFLRHISIVRTPTEDGVTVYVNKLSSSNVVFPGGKIGSARVKMEYPKGSQGKTGDKGLSSAAGGLPSLDPMLNDVLRLSVASKEQFRQLLAWYFENLSKEDALEDIRQNAPIPVSGIAESSSVLFENDMASNNEPYPEIGANSIPQPTPLSSPERDHVIPVDVQGSLESDTRSLKTDEREAVVKVRFGQGNFREALFNEMGHGARCWMSGIEGGRLLIASHIKPWSHCENDADSRGRTDNGLLLSALWDAAFDAGLVSFDSDWNVVASSDLTESARRALDLDKYLALPEKFRTAGRKAYLAYHLANVFEYWKKMGLA